MNPVPTVESDAYLDLYDLLQYRNKILQYVALTERNIAPQNGTAADCRGSPVPAHCLPPTALFGVREGAAGGRARRCADDGGARHAGSRRGAFTY